VSKQGSTLSGIMDAFAIAVSLGLQYGVPLEAFVNKYVNMRFEPSGITNDPDIRLAASLMDYIFRRLALEYLPAEKRASLGVMSVEERKRQVNGETTTSVEAAPAVQAEPVPPAQPQLIPFSDVKASMRTLDAPLCYACGSQMQPAGSCYVCSACGSTSGCS
jgi:ribonucleoside-diphosphate reductase alpha chain